MLQQQILIRVLVRRLCLQTCLSALDDIEAAVATVQEEWKVKILNTSKGFRRKMEKVLRRQAQGLPAMPKAVTVGRVEPESSAGGRLRQDTGREQESSVVDSVAGQRDSQQWCVFLFFNCLTCFILFAALGMPFCQMILVFFFAYLGLGRS